MVTILVCAISFLLNCWPAFAQDPAQTANEAPGIVLQSVIHWTLLLIGIAFAARLALQAFGRAVPVENVPTFPKYMTSPQQYRLGGWAFVLFACGFFLLLVHEHRHVLTLAQLFNVIPKAIDDTIKEEINSPSAPYLIVIFLVGVVYLYCLTQEKPWNVLLMMRDVIHGWISVPQLVKRIVAQIQFSLRVPEDMVPDVIAASQGVVTAQDFHKDVNTPDRKWAETCYMKWWLTRAAEGGEDATFFTEDSFAFDKLVEDFARSSRDMAAWKSGAVVDLVTSKLPQTVDELHKRFVRMVACYLIYRNGSRKGLYAAAENFGVKLPDRISENPLRYWIIYVIALMASVYAGVHVSALAFDLAKGHGFNAADDSNMAVRWTLYSMSNYGLAIVVILLLRLWARSLESAASQSHLITYCWTFLVAFVAGPAGLTLAAHFFGATELKGMPLYALYYELLKWGLGPALISVYISYYLDRQTYADLPDIDHSARTIGWRLLNCFAFASFTLFLLLPALLALPARDYAWDVSKLRFVASGTTFCIALGLALAAQFALRKGTETGEPARSPQPVH